jgi:hypothetical protein
MKVTIKFDVNLATRIAVFGASTYGLSESAFSEAGPATATAAAGPSLGDAPISLLAEIFGYTSDGDWIQISDGGAGLALARRGPQTRCANGFLLPNSDTIWPRLWLGVSMDQIIAMVPDDGTSAFKEFRGANLQWFAESESLEYVRLEVRLVDSGLSISYCATSARSLPGPISNAFTIPWAILILRYPDLGRLNPRAKKHRC